MSHMQAQMTKKREWLEVDGPMGTEWVDLADLPRDDVRHFLSVMRLANDKADGRGRPRLPKSIASFFENHEVWEAKLVKGYGVRSSAPGYIDATSWTVYSSLKDARRAYADEKRALRE